MRSLINTSFNQTGSVKGLMIRATVPLLAPDKAGHSSARDSEQQQLIHRRHPAELSPVQFPVDGIWMSL